VFEASYSWTADCALQRPSSSSCKNNESYDSGNTSCYCWSSGLTSLPNSQITPMIVCPAKPHINQNQGLVNMWHHNRGTNQCPTARIMHQLKWWQPLAFIDRHPSHLNKLIADEANPHSHCGAVSWVNPTPTIPLFNNPLISPLTPKSPLKSCRNSQNIFDIHQTYINEHHMIITVF